MVRLISISLLFFATAVLHAGVVTWDGDSGDKEWFNPINWDGDFVPVANDDVIIPSSFVVNLTEDTAIQSLRVNGMLTIENSGVLDVFVAGQNGVTINNGMLVVDGTINVALAGTNGVEIRNSADLIINGKFTINDVGLHGINLLSNAELRVSGTLDIINAASKGINMIQHCSVEILRNASVAIEQVQSGILITSSFINNGAILISQPIISGIFNDGINIVENGILENLLSGSIAINSEFDRGMVNRGEVLNSGAMTIENSTLIGLCTDNSGSFENSGELSIHSILRDAVEFSRNSVFENRATGEISISGVNEVSQSIDLVQSTMINDGRISMFNFEGHGIFIRAGSMINSGEIFISSEGGQRLISNDGSFINSTDGTIIMEVDNADRIISNTQLFMNEGIIDYTGIFTESFVNNYGFNTLFENSGILSAGALAISEAIKIQSSSTMINSGEIDIVVGSLLSRGIEVSGDAVMTNTSSGDIMLDVMGTSSGDPMFIEVGSVFDGFGLFDIRMN